METGIAGSEIENYEDGETRNRDGGWWPGDEMGLEGVQLSMYLVSKFRSSVTVH